ncbi:DinB family protein [Aliifodinibius sp. S!AR15-10]|uniref:DinB family protein n=1 Tax=Aliifodinibius sp. S!AR15-10 TaxID=2950437 RepID=UPI002856C00C|nr:DinB family protein [Aliifodinibius sp. S!AR15-10]MDR8393941.1 DinB family protein [Aliifodinibius sp. S!AR15-10]
MILFFAVSTVNAQNQQQSNVVEDFLNIYNMTSDKASQLADAIPADKFSWRPAEGIRSVQESVLHMAGANYFFSSMMGATIPEGIDPRSFEKTEMSKEEVISTLKKSVAFVQEAVTNMPEKEFDIKIDMFGNEVRKRQVMFLLGDHAAEHLGQLIAYARMNGVAPPWSQQAR